MSCGAKIRPMPNPTEIECGLEPGHADLEPDDLPGQLDDRAAERVGKSYSLCVCGEPNIRAAEFFAGIGLVREALAEAGISVAWSNDIEPCKASVYAENFGSADFLLDDVRNVNGADIPTVDVATASFPCTDLSLAGNRLGIREGESSMFWQFARVLDEMGARRPRVIMLENVPGFATSHGGRDLYDAISELNRLGYACDILAVNALHFVPQSRLRVFIVGSLDNGGTAPPLTPDEVRPQWVIDFMSRCTDLRFHTRPLALPRPSRKRLRDFVDRVPADSDLWWDDRRTSAFISSLSTVQLSRLRDLQERGSPQWRTAYRRTRHGVAVWEIRPDPIAGCLRTARGGSSRQAVVEVAGERVAVRWMTAREYAALQGARRFKFSSVSENKALFGFGDAVCVPVVAWIGRSYLRPLLVED